MQKLLKLFNPFFKYAITALLIFIPLFQKFPAIRIMGIYVAIRLEDFLILGTLLLFLVPILLNIKDLVENKVVRAMIIFFAVGFISLLSGIFLTQTIVLKIGLLHWIRRIEYLSMFVIGFIFIKRYYQNEIVDYIIKVLLVVNVFIFAYGIGQHYLNFPVIITQNEEYSKGVALRWIPGAHINSTFAGHYDLTSYLVLTVPIFVSAFFVVKNKLSKVLLLVSTGFALWLFSVAASRISVVAFLLATSMSLFLLKKYKEIVIVALFCIIAFIFSPDLRIRYGRIFDVIKQKISSTIVVYAQEGGNVNEDRSTSIRLNVEWPRAMRAFYKNPIFGTGYSSITLATDNDYLRALGETGILGLLSLILLFISLLVSIYKYKLDSSFDSILIASFIGSTFGVILTAVFIDILEASKFATMYWLLAGFVVGISSNKKYV